MYERPWGNHQGPGQDNSPHKAGVLPEKVGGEEPGWGGAYEEAYVGSTAPCKAGPHIHLDEDIASKEVVRDGVNMEDDEEATS